MNRAIQPDEKQVRVSSLMIAKKVFLEVMLCMATSLPFRIDLSFYILLPKANNLGKRRSRRKPKAFDGKNKGGEVLQRTKPGEAGNSGSCAKE